MKIKLYIKSEINDQGHETCRHQVDDVDYTIFLAHEHDENIKQIRYL